MRARSDPAGPSSRHHTLRNLTLGWWGTISFFVTWYYLFSNLFAYVDTVREAA